MRRRGHVRGEAVGFGNQIWLDGQALTVGVDDSSQARGDRLALA
jgi:hypothetical protein